MYQGLMREKALARVDEGLLKGLEGLWQTAIPSKVLVFGWRLLLGCLPTREALMARVIDMGALGCSCAILHCLAHVLKIGSVSFDIILFALLWCIIRFDFGGWWNL